MSEAPREVIRLDKWLYQARFFKTRSLATALVSAGRVRVNGQRVTRPGRSVGAGDVLTFPQAGEVRVVRVIACGTRRGPASEALTLYDVIGDVIGAERPDVSSRLASGSSLH